MAHEASHWLTIMRLVGVGLGVSIAPSCVRSITTPGVRCVPLRGVSVLSELALVHRVDEDRPMVHAFEGEALAHRRRQSP